MNVGLSAWVLGAFLHFIPHALDAPFVFVIPSLVAGCAFAGITGLWAQLYTSGSSGYGNVTTALILLALSAYTLIAFYQILNAPTMAWDVMDFWAPLASELGHGTPGVKFKQSHQPMLIPANIALWNNSAQMAEVEPASLGSKLMWVSMVSMIIAISMLIGRLLGIKSSMALLTAVMLLTCPLLENHMNLYGYSELGVLMFLLGIVVNAVAYKRFNGKLWLWFVPVCIVGAALSRNTGAMYAVIVVAGLPICTLIGRNSAHILSIVGVAVFVSGLAVGLSIREQPGNVRIVDNAIVGEMDVCSAEAKPVLFLRLYGVGSMVDQVTGETYLNTKVRSTITENGQRFIVDNITEPIESVVHLRAQCRDESGKRLNGFAFPVSERQLTLGTGLSLHTGYGRVVVFLKGRSIQIDPSLRNFGSSLFRAGFINSSFSTGFILLLLVIGGHLGKQRCRIQNSGGVSWIGGYSVVIATGSFLFYLLLFLISPYFRYNSLDGNDTIGTRSLVPLLTLGFQLATFWICLLIDEKVTAGKPSALATHQAAGGKHLL